MSRLWSIAAILTGGRAFWAPCRRTLLRPLVLALALALGAGLALPHPPAAAKDRHAAKSERHKQKSERHKPKPSSGKGAKAAPGKGETAPSAAEAPPPEPPAPPYEPQVLRLAEILGALAYLDELCGPTEGADWRGRMQAFMETEASTPRRKERLAGLFNRSFRGYERSYQICTANAQAAITRFLREGGAIARDLVERYGAS